ncbi:MAG: hypothetical protein JNL82_10825 [Myxococcales bacterium]|nr:hypothetical protein [Myxococcales bacterium]
MHLGLPLLLLFAAPTTSDGGEHDTEDPAIASESGALEDTGDDLDDPNAGPPGPKPKGPKGCRIGDPAGPIALLAPTLLLLLPRRRR